MTNEELAELERQRDLEIRLAHAKDAEHALMQCVDELRATAREVEALRAEIVALWHDSNSEKPLYEHLGMTVAEFSAWAIGRAALEQGEVK